MVTVERDVYTVAEAATQLGVSQLTIRRWLGSGVLPHVQPGGAKGRILIPRDVVDRMLAAAE